MLYQVQPADHGRKTDLRAPVFTPVSDLICLCADGSLRGQNKSIVETEEDDCANTDFQ
jgi:hypothetical protein